MSLTIAAEEAATVDVDTVRRTHNFALRVVPQRAVRPLTLLKLWLRRLPSSRLSR